jgi:hypothetical protein
MIHYSRFHDMATAEDYLEKKFEAIPAIDTDERRGIATALVSQTGAVPPSLATEEQLPRHSKRQRNYLVQRASLESPLLSGESLVEEDFASFLVEDFGDIPAGTVGLRRRTTHAELYYFLPCVYVRDGQILRRRPEADTPAGDDDQSLALPSPADEAPAAIVPPPSVLTAQVTVFGWGSIAIALGQALVGGIGDSIGTKVFNAVFGSLSSVPAWFGEMYEKFVAAVSQAFSENWKKDIEIEIRTVADEVKLYNNTGNRRQLQEAENLSVRLVNNMETFGPSLVANYLTGAGLHLLVLQQQALVDKNPDGYKEAIKAQAHRLSKWAQESRIKVMDDRMAKITPVRSEKVGNSQGWGFYDHAINQRWWYPDIPGAGKSGKPNADREHAAHSANVRAATTENLRPVLEVTAEWQKLIERPLPPHSGA